MAKAKVRARHQEAIAAFQAWHAKNPKADPHRVYAQFDAMIDSAALQMELAQHVAADRKKLKAGA